MDRWVSVGGSMKGGWEGWRFAHLGRAWAWAGLGLAGPDGLDDRARSCGLPGSGPARCSAFLRGLAWRGSGNGLRRRLRLPIENRDIEIRSVGPREFQKKSSKFQSQIRPRPLHNISVHAVRAFRFVGPMARLASIGARRQQRQPSVAGNEPPLARSCNRTHRPGASKHTLLVRAAESLPAVNATGARVACTYTSPLHYQTHQLQDLSRKREIDSSSLNRLCWVSRVGSRASRVRMARISAQIRRDG